MLTHNDAQYLDEMVNLIKVELENCRLLKKNFNEDEFLKKHGALDDEGIVCEYPVLKYEIGDKEFRQDEGGQMLGLKTKMEVLQDEGKKCWIEYLPRFYSFYKLARKIMSEEK